MRKPMVQRGQSLTFMDNAVRSPHAARRTSRLHDSTPPASLAATRNSF